MGHDTSISILGSGWLGLPLAEHLLGVVKTIHLSTRSLEKSKQLATLGFKAHLVDIEEMSTQVQTFLNSEILIINITNKSIEAFQNLRSEIEKSTIKHVLFISSTSVYVSDQSLCKETDSIHVENNLRKIEKLFTDNTHFDCTIIRLAGLIGPKRHPGRFFAGGKVIKDGNAKVNLIHRVDCIRLITTVLEQNAWGEVFNGCADTHPVKKEYYSKMALSLGYPEPEYIIADKGSNKVICNEKIKTALGFQFIYPDLYHINW